MLSADEFTVGYLGSAEPTSLVVPRFSPGEAILVGHIDGNPTAAFITGKYANLCFESKGNTSWSGLIVPGVRVEVDEATLFEPSRLDAPFGSIIRLDTRLVVRARRERSFGDATHVTLQDNLASAGELRAGFTKWQVIIGEGVSKRILWSTEMVKTKDE
jgi:hypothetical protein